LRTGGVRTFAPGAEPCDPALAAVLTAFAAVLIALARVISRLRQ
jgi:hypothetical protein